MPGIVLKTEHALGLKLIAHGLDELPGHMEGSGHIRNRGRTQGLDDIGDPFVRGAESRFIVNKVHDFGQHGLQVEHLAEQAVQLSSRGLSGIDAAHGYSHLRTSRQYSR